MGQHTKPDTRPVASGGTGTEYMTISPDADKALNVWSEIVTDRIKANDPEHRTRVHYDKIDAILAKHNGTVYGHLLAFAINDARTCALFADDLGAGLQAVWDMAVKLRDEERRINPPQQIKIEQANTCRHGVAFTDDCVDCDTDFS